MRRSAHDRLLPAATRHLPRHEPSPKRRSSKVIWTRSGWWRGSIYWVLLVSGRLSVTKPLFQIQRSTLWLLQGLSPRPSFGGFGLRMGGGGAGCGLVQEFCTCLQCVGTWPWLAYHTPTELGVGDLSLSIYVALPAGPAHFLVVLCIR